MSHNLLKKMHLLSKYWEVILRLSTVKVCTVVMYTSSLQPWTPKTWRGADPLHCLPPKFNRTPTASGAFLQLCLTLCQEFLWISSKMCLSFIWISENNCTLFLRLTWSRLETIWKALNSENNLILKLRWWNDESENILKTFVEKCYILKLTL